MPMNYEELANQLLENSYKFRRNSHQAKIDESMRGEHFVLSYIDKMEGGVLPGEISNEMAISTARTAAALNSLENKGLIKREIDKNDRRRILVYLTPQGKELAEKRKRVVLESARNMLEWLGEEDAKEFVRIIGRFSEFPAKNRDQEEKNV